MEAPVASNTSIFLTTEPRVVAAALLPTPIPAWQSTFAAKVFSPAKVWALVVTRPDAVLLAFPGVTCGIYPPLQNRDNPDVDRARRRDCVPPLTVLALQEQDLVSHEFDAR